MNPRSARLLLLVFLIAGCSPPRGNEWRLPPALGEVSGLAATASGTLFMMNDEWARVYEFDPVSRVVEARFDLGDPVAGDFEGIAIDGERTYLVTSDGLLYFAKGDAFTVIDTGLSDICEVEGLESTGATLLILCKTMYRKADKGQLTIYRFDVDSRLLEPYLRVAYETLGIKQLNPSAIAERDGMLYILAARQEKLLVLDSAFKLVRLISLSGHPQAEGIVVLPGGEIYIADEGKQGGGKLTRYQGINDIPQ